MKKKNIILISLDEVRSDNLSCYGYSNIQTKNIDQIASEGVRFETCITSSELTPIAMSSVITGKYPNKTTYRNPFCYVNGPTIADILKEQGYNSAGFVGNGLLGKNHGFGSSFNFWNEPSNDSQWNRGTYPGYEKIMHYEGNYWVEEFFNWLKKNYNNPFFIWGHFYETHEGSEHQLLEKGLIKESKLTDFGYKDAKIKMADENLIGRLINILNELNLYEEIILVVLSDHGTNLGEHEVDPIPWRKGGIRYTQHTTMYDHDLKVALIIKDKNLPKNKEIKGMVRSIDLVPTLLALIGISKGNIDFDGKSLLPVIEKGQAEGEEVYSEDLFEVRGRGAIQAIRTDSFKFIRNLTLGIEEYYDLNNDPQEKSNIKDRVKDQTLIELRKKMNGFLMSIPQTKTKEFSDKEKEEIKERLKRLGYIK